jgi:hypothetical protein
MAALYARHYKLPFFAGSDNHEGVVDRYVGIEADRRYNNITDMLKAAAEHPEWIFCRTYAEMTAGQSE